MKGTQRRILTAFSGLKRVYSREQMAKVCFKLSDLIIELYVLACDLLRVGARTVTMN
jgi:hypothetical protein